MGKRGPKPTPTSILKLRGSWRAKNRGKEPTPEVKIPPAPKFLTGEALVEWRRITKLLAEVGCIAQQDRALLAAYCIEWAKFVRANNQLRVCKSLLTKTTRGTKTSHPLLRISDRAFAKMLKICAEFGLSPSSRTRLNTEDDPLVRMISKQETQKKQKFFD